MHLRHLRNSQQGSSKLILDGFDNNTIVEFAIAFSKLQNKGPILNPIKKSVS